MEDEVIQSTITTTEPASDVVMTANTSPESTAGYVEVQEPSNNVTLPPVEGALPENPVTPEQPGMMQAPKTEREQAIEYIESQKDLSYTNKDHGISNWIRNNYNYDPTVAGTMWVAGKINDAPTQMGFLEAIVNESMYDEMDLQKYFFDQNLATARAYAAQKKFETAYGFYRAAQEKALAEGELTGWYMPAEGTYMLGQWTVADQILKDPNASDSDKKRAQAVQSSTTKWFEANNITERGIKCLNLMYLEETIRHNKENERLQEAAQEIQKKANAAANAAAKANYDLQLREWQFNNDQMELQFGADLDENGVIGFQNSDYVTEGFGFRDYETIFGTYKSQYDWAINNPTQAFMVTNRAFMKEVLGDQYNTAYNSYLKGVQDDSWLKAQYDTGNGYIEGKNIDSIYNKKLKATSSNKVTGSGDIKTDGMVKIIRTDNNGAQLWLFNDDGIGYQITDGTLEFIDGKTVNDILQEQGLVLDKTSKPYMTYTDEKGKTTDLYIGRQNYSSNSQVIGVKGKDYYPGIGKDAIEAIKKAMTDKGFKYEYGLRDLDNENSPLVMSKMEDGKKVYYAMDPYTGKYGKIGDQQDVVDVHRYSDGSYSITKADGSSLTSWQDLPKNKQEDAADTLFQSQLIGTFKDSKGKEQNIYCYTNSDGSCAYWYGDLTRSDNKYGITAGGGVIVNGWMSEKDVKQHVSELDKIISSKENYVNDVFIDNSKFTSTDTTVGIVDQQEKEYQEEKAENSATIKTTAFTGGSSGTINSGISNLNNKNTNTSNKDKTNIELLKYEYGDTNFDELLGEHGETLFTQEQIEKQNKGLLEDKSYQGTFL